MMKSPKKLGIVARNLDIDSKCFHPRFENLKLEKAMKYFFYTVQTYFGAVFEVFFTPRIYV